MEIEIRDVLKKDLDGIKSLIAETWFVSDYFENEKGSIKKIANDTEAIQALSSMYLNPVLHDSTFGKVFIYNCEVVGVIFGSRVSKKPCFAHLQSDGVEEMLQLLQLDEKDRQLVIELFVKTEQAYLEMIEDKLQSYQGCLELFIVSEKMRGKQIGKKLLTELIKHFKNQSVQQFYVFTDNICNYGFYDHMSFARVAEKEQEITTDLMDASKESFKIFLYEYTV